MSREICSFSNVHKINHSLYNSAHLKSSTTLTSSFPLPGEQVLTFNPPGIHLAERNLFIGVAKLLWAFDFSVKRGEQINISAETGLSQGFLHCVKEYGSSITLRSEVKRDTILREFQNAQTTFAKFE